jgi:glycosyltransferase involved in cell wall biosynthesis
VSTEAERPFIDVSVIVPFHNAVPYLERCIEAICEQSYQPERYEIIFVNSNSTDGSPELVARYSRIRMVSEATPGSYAARNRGVRESNGRILAFTDSDCVASKNWLAELVMPFETPEVGLVQGSRSLGTNSRALAVVAPFEDERAAYSLSPEGIHTQFGYTNNMAVRRTVFERCGPFVEIMRGADSIFVDRVINTYSGRAARFSQRALVKHLEVTSIRKWLAKKIIYGKSFKQTRSTRMAYRDLTINEWRSIYRRTVAKHDYSVIDRAMLLVIVNLGVLCFELGRIMGRSKSTANKHR